MIGLEQRLSMLASEGLPLKSRIRVYWHHHQIPFVEAEYDADLAVSLGVIHVHLRWCQMEILRKVALGRVSEMAGPFAIGIDRALRALGLARTAEDIFAILPHETAHWLECYVAGINHAVENTREVPREFRILGIRREKWRSKDILAVGRLLAADATWPCLFALLREPNRALAAEVWQRAIGLDAPRVADIWSAGAPEIGRVLAQWFGRPGGSNAIAVAPSRSASGSAWVAGEPHLPATLPNPFIIAGYKSPSFHVVGLMIAGLPFMAVGRNADIAWGSTNLHAASSDLFDLSDLQSHEFFERLERLHVRWWRDRTVSIRESAYGPVISDLSILASAHPRSIALRWVGRAPSDEITAMLKINRARDWDEFRASLKTFAVPGQNLVYADADGHIGKLMAARLPCRPMEAPKDPVLPVSENHHWQKFVGASDLPTIFDPTEGFVTSANEAPSRTAARVGYIFSSDARVKRLTQLLKFKPRLGFPDLVRLQLDVGASNALDLRDELLRIIRRVGGELEVSARKIDRALAEWDGQYAAESRGALAFELLVFYLMRALYGRRRLAVYDAIWNGWDLICADIASAGPGIARAMRRAVKSASHGLDKYFTWGQVHRLRLMHPLGVVPFFRRRYRFGDWPVAGGAETVLRTAHRLSAGRHHISLVASARYLLDLSHPDGNHFVLLGGQDGWMDSTTMLDQVPLWKDGLYVQIPLSLDTVRRTFTIRTELMP